MRALSLDRGLVAQKTRVSLKGGRVKPAIIEATWNDKPTFLIALIDSDGIARKALWKLEGTEGATRQGDKKVGPYELEALPDARAIWTNRISWGWHSPDRRDAQKALDILNKILP